MHKYFKRKKSCRSTGERDILLYLQENNIQYIREKTFSTCKSPKNYPLRFDFYLPEYNILIEFQGIHHYQPINKSYRSKRVHEKTVLHDKIKNKFAIENGISLVCIHYKDKQKIKDIIKYNIEGIKDEI